MTTLAVCVPQAPQLSGGVDAGLIDLSLHPMGTPVRATCPPGQQAQAEAALADSDRPPARHMSDSDLLPEVGAWFLPILR